MDMTSHTSHKRLSRSRYRRLSLFAIILFALAPRVWADAEVRSNAQNIWQASVDGRLVYRGAAYATAMQRAMDEMGEATLHVRSNGVLEDHSGNLYALRPKTGQTIDFHGNRLTAWGDVVVPIYCDRRNRITIRNMNLNGSPRYGVWFRGCSDITFDNISMDLSRENPVGLGVRVDASTGPSRNLTIMGDVKVNGARGHGIETYGVDGFEIGDVTVTNTGGCGLLLNDSRNGTVGRVSGHHNNPDGGYATFRVANNNGPNVFVEGVFSRNSGRGFFSVSGSHGTTVNYVDIADTYHQGILLENAAGTHVLSGSVANGHRNCRLKLSTNSSINVIGCDPMGTPPSAPVPDDPHRVEGLYRLTPLHSQKAVDLAMCSDTNGANVQQYDWLGNNCQKWQITPVDGGPWHRLSPVAAATRALQVQASSTRARANVDIATYNAMPNQLFSVQSAGQGQWRFINKNSNMCLSVDSQGNLVQNTCQTGVDQQLFELERQ